MYKRQIFLVIASALLLSACSGPRASEGGFHSDNPAAKLYAIRQAGDNKDASDIAPLVEQLESDDPAVRMFTIEALEQITGTRMGYNPYGSFINRQPAVRKWVEAVNSGQFATSDNE